MTNDSYGRTTHERYAYDDPADRLRLAAPRGRAPAGGWPRGQRLVLAGDPGPGPGPGPVLRRLDVPPRRPHRCLAVGRLPGADPLDGLRGAGPGLPPAGPAELGDDQVTLARRPALRRQRQHE